MLSPSYVPDPDSRGRGRILKRKSAAGDRYVELLYFILTESRQIGLI